MTEQEEAHYEAAFERDLRSHREVPTGRNFLAWNMRQHGGAVKQRYDEGYCRTFPNAPGSMMCGACDHEGCELRKAD